MARVVKGALANSANQAYTKILQLEESPMAALNFKYPLT